MQKEPRRIDGWKAIGVYVGRDRSTVIRWANRRGLPIHAVPGGTSNRTVYAMADELDAWLKGPAAADREPDGIDAAPAAAEMSAAEAVGTMPVAGKALHPKRRGLFFAAFAGGSVIAIGVASLAMLSTTPPTSSPTVPRAPNAALMHARDLIAERSARSLASANMLLQRLSAAYPHDARPNEALAEAAVLGREFAATSDASAFAAAREAANQALSRDPTSATAWRSLGYVRYWGDRRPHEAGLAFRRALEIAPRDALAHLWYANSLSDTGEETAAAAQMAAARALNPGQPYILADAAWARWNVGHTAESRAALERLAVDHPGVASIEDCLSIVLLSTGDVVGYASHLRRRATDRTSPTLIAYARLIDDALARGDRREVYHVILAHALNVADTTMQADHSFAAFVASIFGDRREVDGLVRDAIAAGERWGSSGYRRRILERWPDDSDLAASMRRLTMPPVGHAGA